MLRMSCRIILVAALTCLPATRAIGQTSTWTGQAGNNNWNATNFLGLYLNWNPSVSLPSSGTTVVFGSGFGSGNPNLNGSRNVNAVVINAVVPFTIVGGAADTLSIGSGTITRQGGAIGVHTLSTRVNLGAHGNWFIDGNPALGRLVASNVIAGSGAFGITKTGAGLLVLSGANTYSGQTQVQQGTLLVNNVMGSGTGSGGLSVSAGARLGGTGSIAGATQIAGNGILAPGDAVGTLTFNTGLALSNNAVLDLEIAAGTADRVRIMAGTFSLAGIVDLSIRPAAVGAGGGTYTLLDWTGATPSDVDLSRFVVRPGSIRGQLAIVGSTLQYTVPPVLYVKASAGGANDGTSWTNAYTSLQSALAAAVAGDEIWVAAGTYFPTTAPDHTATFQLKNNVKLYGGFPGNPGEEGVFSVRDYAVHTTTLSGLTTSPRTRHVVTGTGTNNTAILDGFTIRDGSGNNDISMGQFGGGLYNNPGSPTIVNCVFRNNNSWWGGAMANFSGSQPRAINCLFFANSAGSLRGGAVYNQQCAPFFDHCTFFGNIATEGGAIYNNVGSPTLTNSILWGNMGGQMVNVNASYPVVRYTCIAGGWAGIGNIVTDPLFVDAAAYDLRLQPHSPCIGAGNNNDLPADLTDMDGDFDTSEPIPYDAAGLARRVVAVVDMGAYEHQSPAIPHRPTNLVVAPVDTQSIQLEWDDNADPDLVGYNVYRTTVATSLPTPTDLIASSVGTSSFLDDNLDSSTLYYYWVSAVDADSYESTPSLRAQATPLPSAPTAFTATSVSSTHINLNWSDNPESDLASYKVYRGESSGFDVGPASLLVTLPAATSTYLDGGRTAGVTYYYTVTAVDTAGGESLPGVEASAVPAAQDTIIYVNIALPEGGSGTSWADAFKELRTALQVAEAGDQIWVAVGTYGPGPVRTSAFALKNGVELYGGFAGTESSIAQRGQDPDPLTVDPATDSVLSGEIPGQNVYHVLTAHGTNATAVLDGFTVAYGRASGAPNPNFENIGGGIYVNNGGPTLRNCQFIENSALVGSAICTIGGTAMTITNCSFRGNFTLGGGDVGAALYTQGVGHTLIHCAFLGNTAGRGGAIYNSGGAHTTVINGLFSGNSASFRGGAIANGSSVPTRSTLINCTFVGNSAPEGSAVANGDVGGVACHSTLTNCIVWGNSGIQLFNSPTAANTTTVNYSCIEGGHAGTANISADPLLVDPAGPDGIAGTADDNARLQSGSPCVNTGSNSAVPVGVFKDLDRQHRFAGCLVDMGAYELPGVSGMSVPGDFDGDCDVDADDLALFSACARGPAIGIPTECADKDFDSDNDVDQVDFGYFQRCWTGPDRLGDLACLLGPPS